MSILNTPSLVIAFTTFETIDEAIELANATTYSITSSVWSENYATALEVASQLRFGKYLCEYSSSTISHDRYRSCEH